MNQIFILIVIFLVVFFLIASNRQNRKPRSRSRVSSTSQKKLFLLLRGDKKTALRLIDSLQYKYPNQSQTWYWEKAIYDLERDRRA